MRNQCRLILRDYVTIGHGVMLHGCTVESNCLIGMRATILNNVKVGSQSIVGAGALITEGIDNSAAQSCSGHTRRVKREVTDAEVQGIDDYAQRY